MKTVTQIKSKGILFVGTTEDYFPLSYFDENKGVLAGSDVLLAEKIGAALECEVKFVKTTWPMLEQDLFEGKYDLAVCGITITESRKEKFLMSKGYKKTGKTILCRREDEVKFTDLCSVNNENITIMYNPGGTNEKFVQEKCPLAKKIVHAENHKIPDLIADGKADVMITETVEAEYYIKVNKKLAAPLISRPFTNDEFGVMMDKGNVELLKVVNSVIG